MSEPLDSHEQGSSRHFGAWGLLLLAGLGVLFTCLVGLGRALQQGYSLMPPSANALASLREPATGWALFCAVIVVTMLLPLQRWGEDRRHHSRLSLGIAVAFAMIVGVVWILRLNLVGFASLWASRTPLGDIVFPTAVLEMRVWSGNIALVLATSIFGLVVRGVFERGLLPRKPRPVPPMWIAMAGLALICIALIAAMPPTALSPVPDRADRILLRWVDDTNVAQPMPVFTRDDELRSIGLWSEAERSRDEGHLTVLSVVGRSGRAKSPGSEEGFTRFFAGRDEASRIERTLRAVLRSSRSAFVVLEVESIESIACVLEVRKLQASEGRDIVIALLGSPASPIGEEVLQSEDIRVLLDDLMRVSEGNR